MITHKLTVDGEDWTERLLSADVQYRADVGSSGLQMELTGSCEEYDDAPIRLSLGEEGNLSPYFKGRLQGPDDDDRLDKSTANAFGPFRNMITQKLGTNETFVGQTLEYVILECARRANQSSGEIIIKNGTKYRVQPGEQFPFDNNIGDVLSSLLEKAEFVGVDQPEGRREFKPKPRSGSNKNYKATLGPTEYTELEISPKEESVYSMVVVYRNGDEGTPIVKAEREIITNSRIKPPKQRWFVVSDFEGNQDEAEEEAYKLADELRLGLNSFSITIPFNKRWRVHEGLKVIRIKRKQSRIYSCFIDDGITVNYAPGSAATMQLSGSAYEIRHKRESIIEAPKRVVSSGIYKSTTTNIG